MVNYIVSDMITRLRNGIRVKKTSVSILSTNLTQSIASILKREGFIESIESPEPALPGYKTLNLVLKYHGKRMIPAFSNLKCISRPGVRFYANSREIPQVLGGLGITILSTSKGILTDKEARQMGIGGEILCSIW